MAYLFEFDSVHGRFDGEVRHCEKTGKRFLLIAGHEIQVFDCKTPAEIPWKDLCIDTVIESSGEFVTSDAAKGHLQAGAKNVLLSAPTSDGKIPTFVFGVNQELYNPATMPIISNASCTTNALAPLVKLLHDNYGLDEGIATTIHAGMKYMNIILLVAILLTH